MITDVKLSLGHTFGHDELIDLVKLVFFACICACTDRDDQHRHTIQKSLTHTAHGIGRAGCRNYDQTADRI